jgi:deoxyribodipyrimidine photolyase-related protein
MKKLLLILGDQLDINSPLLVNIDYEVDTVVMIESTDESTYVWSHKAKIVLFLSAMRHFAQELQARQLPLIYVKESQLTLMQALKAVLIEHHATHLVCLEPGEWRLKTAIQALAIELNVELIMHDDSHFYCGADEFRAWVADKKELRLEYFYRYMRKKHQVLMEDQDQPEGGKWNFDDQNRHAYAKNGPGFIDAPIRFEVDEITRGVFEYVQQHYSQHPGALADFSWPVTRAQALDALAHFLNHRLVHFGIYQDAMWTDTPFGWHSILSISLNLKLINPREVVNQALDAYRNQHLDLATVEGFIRQIIGWREFIRGIYYLDMPDMANANFYQHERALPEWYWTSQSKMNCMKDTIGQTLKYGYAHHIQRLMVTGNFALLAEISPKAVSDWYLAIYMDAVEWVELPNVIGMALFANGGRFTSKPYIASGAYIKRMSNYCQGCQYRPEVRYGNEACPVTTLYWNFLIKHQVMLGKNPRTRLMTANLSKISAEDQQLIQIDAKRMLDNLNVL